MNEHRPVVRSVFFILNGGSVVAGAGRWPESVDCRGVSGDLFTLNAVFTCSEILHELPILAERQDGVCLVEAFHNDTTRKEHNHGPAE